MGSGGGPAASAGLVVHGGFAAGSRVLEGDEYTEHAEQDHRSRRQCRHRATEALGGQFKAAEVGVEFRSS